ncbi:hypothetical protein ACFWBN_34420 [Streptomyces sp. NPDC059989]|uniref:hypothetical protein n=1 Tax=Streptomyces sp. NPDC059989 TaxID=3347026 RepID=UPI0036820056
MPPPQAEPITEPSEEGGDDDCVRVRRVLSRAGFDTSPREGDGLRVFPVPEGVMVGWVAREVLRPTVQVHGHEKDLSRFTSLAGLHKALQTALAVILREAGFDVATRDEHLLVLRRGTRPADGGGRARR